MHGTWAENHIGHGHIDVVPLDWVDLEFVAFHMRDIDKHEIYGNLPTTNPLEFASMFQQAIAKNGCGYTGKLDGRPALIAALFENFAGNWQISSFGTNNWSRVVAGLRPKWQNMKAFALDHGMHRLECKSLASHVEAHRWLMLMGFRREAVLRGYGKDGGDYFLFTRLWQDRKPVFEPGVWDRIDQEGI